MNDDPIMLGFALVGMWTCGALGIGALVVGLVAGAIRWIYGSEQ